MMSANANEEQTRLGVMDGTIPLAVVDSSTTSNVRKYGDGLQLIGQPS